MSSSSSGWCGESGGGRPQVRHAEEDQLLVAVAGRREQAPRRSIRPGTSPISSSHSRAAAASADSPGSTLPAGSSHSSRRRRPVLPDQNHAAVIVDRKQHDRRSVPHDRHLVLAAVRKAAHVSTSTEKTRPLIDDRHESLLRSLSTFSSRSSSSTRCRSSGSSLSNSIRRPSDRMCERQPRGVQKRPFEVRHGSQIARHAAVHAAVQANRRRSDGRWR